MNCIIRWFADHATGANLLMLLLLFLGVLGAPQLLRETFPDFDSTKVQVTVAWPGASAEDVEEAICQRIEDAVESVTNVEEVVAEARDSLGSVTVEMVDGADYATFISDIKTEVDAIDDFPEDAEEPVVKEQNRTDMVASVAITGPMSVPDLKHYAEAVKDRLMRSTSISEVDILGFSDRQIRIAIPASDLRQHGLSVVDVAASVGAQSVDLPGGDITTNAEEVRLRFTDMRRTVHEYEELVVVSSATGAELRLGDIARITDTFELDEDTIRFDGQRAALLQVNKTDSQDSLNILAEVREFLANERAVGPPDVSLTLTRNVSKIVADRLAMLVDNGWQGLLLVFGVMWLFFSGRFSFWVAMGLPVSFAGALCAMYLIGFSLNMLTMVGLLLAIGLIMDDAIVIAENIMSHLRRGKSARNASIDGTLEVLPGVFASFMTTLAVFGSLALLVAGDIGKVLWVLPVVLILTLGVSLIEAFLILPRHLNHALHGRENEQPAPWRQRFNARIEAVRENVVGRAVDWTIRWRYLFSGLVIAALIVSASMLAGGVLKLQAFPEIEGDVLEARLLLPAGTPLERTEEVVDRLTTALTDEQTGVNATFKPAQPEQQDLIQHINIQFNTNADAKESGPHLATVSVDLLSAEIRDARMDDIIEAWRTNVGTVPGITSLVYTEPSIGPAGRAIEIRLLGDDLADLESAGRELMDALARYDGVMDLQSDLRPGPRELRMTLRDGASALGLDTGAIARQVRAAFHGTIADEIQVGSESFEIEVRLAETDRDTLGDLDTFTIVGPGGAHIPLLSVVDVSEGRGYSRIGRIDGQRAIVITGDVDTRIANANQIVNTATTTDLPRILANHPGVRPQLEGQAAAGKKTGLSMLTALGTGLFGVFLLLSLQFKSYIEPLVVMLVIPMTLIGVVFGHIAMGYDLSMVSIMGFISLAGIVVNNSILLVEFIRIHVDAGETVADAARQASRQRFRAVLITTLTTVAGMAPLLFEGSMQAQILKPLVISIMFGLSASTLLVLFLVPAAYTILDDFGLARSKE